MQFEILFIRMYLLLETIDIPQYYDKFLVILSKILENEKTNVVTKDIAHKRDRGTNQ